MQSLPLLLSSLRHSSGRNTNMAATSGPVISASNSTQYPASSSGTPCSTSQSSGTLVVPSFISTYSSFGGPAVVSSLPATSSANLPVVVGGSSLWWYDLKFGTLNYVISNLHIDWLENW